MTVQTSLTRAKRIAAAFVGVLLAIATIAVADANSASAATHASSGTWSTTKTYGPGWELDSPNGVYRAIFQGDHNFVVYHGGKAIWASNTDGATADSLVFGGPTDPYIDNGSIGVYVYCTTPCSYPASTKRFGNRVNKKYPAYVITMQNDGNFVEYVGVPGGSALWSTRTNGK